MPKKKELCELNHENLEEVLSALPQSQAKPGRHTCAACAYLAGYQHAQEDVIEKLKVRPRRRRY